MQVFVFRCDLDPAALAAFEDVGHELSSQGLRLQVVAVKPLTSLPFEEPSTELGTDLKCDI